MYTHNSMNNQHHSNQLKSCIRYQSIIIVDIIVKIQEYHFEAMLQGTTSETMPIYYIFHLQLLASDCRISKMRGLSCYVLFVIQLLKRLNRLKFTSLRIKELRSRKSMKTYMQWIEHMAADLCVYQTFLATPQDRRDLRAHHWKLSTCCGCSVTFSN